MKKFNQARPDPTLPLRLGRVEHNLRPRPSPTRPRPDPTRTTLITVKQTGKSAQFKAFHPKRNLYSVHFDSKYKGALHRGKQSHSIKVIDHYLRDLVIPNGAFEVTPSECSSGTPSVVPHFEGCFGHSAGRPFIGVLFGHSRHVSCRNVPAIISGRRHVLIRPSASSRHICPPLPCPPGPCLLLRLRAPFSIAVIAL